VLLEHSQCSYSTPWVQRHDSEVALAVVGHGQYEIWHITVRGLEDLAARSYGLSFLELPTRHGPSREGVHRDVA